MRRYYANLSHYVESDDYFRILAATWTPLQAAQRPPLPPPPPPPSSLPSPPLQQLPSTHRPAPQAGAGAGTELGEAFSPSMRQWREGFAEVSEPFLPLLAAPFIDASTHTHTPTCARFAQVGYAPRYLIPLSTPPIYCAQVGYAPRIEVGVVAPKVHTKRFNPDRTRSSISFA